MSLPDDFVIVDGLITVEPITRPSWLIRKRLHADSLTAPFVWVATMVQEENPRHCSVKGHVARDAFPLQPSDYHALERIGKGLKFTRAKYERVFESGSLRVSHEIQDESAQQLGD